MVKDTQKAVFLQYLKDIGLYYRVCVFFKLYYYDVKETRPAIPATYSGTGGSSRPISKSWLQPAIKPKEELGESTNYL